MDRISALSMWWMTIIKLKVRFLLRIKRYPSVTIGDKRVEISWLNGEKRLYHAGRYLKLAGENQAVIESSTGSSVTVWEQRSEKAKKRLVAVVEQMKKTVLEHLFQQIVFCSLAVILFLLGWRIYGVLRKRGDSPSLM